MIFNKFVAFAKIVWRQMHWWKKYRKVNNQCHYTGKYKGAANSICNLRYSLPKEIPIAFQNGSEYDYYSS